MSVLGLKSGYTVRFGLCPRDCPRAQAKWDCPLVLIRIHFIIWCDDKTPKKIRPLFALLQCFIFQPELY